MKGLPDRAAPQNRQNQQHDEGIFGWSGIPENREFPGTKFLIITEDTQTRADMTSALFIRILICSITQCMTRGI